MELIFILQAIVCLLISAVLIFCFIRNIGNNLTSRATNNLSVIFFCYMSLFLISILWFLDYLTYDSASFFIFYSILIFSQAIASFFIFRVFSSTGKVFYLFLLYILVPIFYFFSFKYFLFSLTFSSFLLSFIFLIILYPNLTNKNKRVFVLGVLYFVCAFIIYLFWIFNNIDLYYPTFFLHLIFLFFIYLFCKDLNNYSFSEKKLENDKGKNYFYIFLKYFLFIVAIVGITLTTTLVVHEFGHVLYAKYSECTYKTIFFEEGSYPYTEVLCPSNSIRDKALMAGPFLPIILSVFLIFVGSLLRYIGLMILGFNLVASFRDLSLLGLSETLLFASQFIGFIFLIFGIALLSKFKFDDLVGRKK